MKLEGKTVLVTGGAGFIGSHISKRLSEMGARVIIVDNLNSYYDPKLKKDRLKVFLKDTPFSFYKCDIADNSKLETVFKENKIDIICHEAAQAGVRYSFEDPGVYFKSNILGTVNIFECARKYKVKGVIFASSSSVYGNSQKSSFSENVIVNDPESLYALTKITKEQIARMYHKSYGIHSTGLRYFTVYGPWGRPDMAIFKFTKAILNNEHLEIYNFGKLKRDFTYIDDVVSGTVRALEKNYPFEIINIGRGKSQELMKFINALETALDKKAKLRFIKHQKGDVLKTSANIKRAQEKLAWKPETHIDIGTAHFVKWYKEYYK